MKILAIMGSPRKKGNTYNVTRIVEESMKKFENIEFEYVFLKDLDLKSCLGCGVCLDKGEELCPLNDDRAMLEEKMHNAAGVIFTSPTYMFNVTGLMKNFIDRFAYACHRPRFFKNAMVLTTSGAGIGTKMMLKSFKMALLSWGFDVVESLDIITNGDSTSKLSTPKHKANKKINYATRKLYKAIQKGKPNPSILGMSMFQFAKKEINKLNPEYYDFVYYNNQGWLKDNTYYYYDSETNFVKKTVSKLFSNFIGLLSF
jgi:multimeric flavodoxin WrbA